MSQKHVHSESPMPDQVAAHSAYNITSLHLWAKHRKPSSVALKCSDGRWS